MQYDKNKFKVSEELKREIFNMVEDIIDNYGSYEWDNEICLPYDGSVCPSGSWTTRSDGVEVEWYINSGASKIVLIPESHYNFVIKIPFTGENKELDWWNDDNDEDEEDYNEPEYEYGDFCCANDTCGKEWDYCYTEEKVYENIIRNDMTKFFAGTYFFSNFKNTNYPIYISLKVTPIRENPEISNKIQSFYDDKKSYRKLCDTYKTRDNYIPMDMGTIYFIDSILGKKTFDKLLKFIEKSGIDDLRMDNIGLFKGKPIILDYSNFNE